MDRSPGMGICVWDVVFVPRGADRWFDRLSPWWCRHVLAYGYASKVGGWVVFNPTEGFTAIDVMTEERFAVWRREMLGRASAILRCRVRSDGGGAGRVGIFCTAAVKHLLGLRSRALRPIGLYRDLLRTDAEVIVDGPESKGAGRRRANAGFAAGG